LVHGNTLTLCQFAQVTMDGVRKTNPKSAHLTSKAPQQATHEAGDVEAEFIVARSGKKLSRTTRAVRIERGEVLAEHAHGLPGIRVVQQLSQVRCHVLHRISKVTKKVPEIVSVLVLPTVSEGQSLEHDEGSRSADRDIPCDRLAVKRSIGQPNTVTVAKGQRQAGRDDGSEIGLQVLKGSRRSGSDRRHQEVDPDVLESLVRPPLSRGVACSFLSGSKSRPRSRSARV
jgi:hypothetical protein